ncbi:myosin-light-chain kinase [Toxoplasma gondii ME49]|uniref:Myosin-light-chain kinase n=1 Tax=Toxoplasma gondii (strain ATCC 50611 / Me49) TaxID=508771 RepID=S8EMV5_TOXGM|nr:myosin-light-chain kinase [Toxoplasma gondii ME49]EPT24531.1 myosin-light-chain kinase [Toxoplasma gondii ME49]|eukprot:XP_018634760.1 myosin-light-chain kinase [Toxoplasma gondii ME49]
MSILGKHTATVGDRYKVRLTPEYGPGGGYGHCRDYLLQSESCWRGDLTSGVRGVLTKKGTRARTTKRHDLVAVTSGEHYWNQGLVYHEEQTAPPVAASSSFMQSTTSLATPADLNAPVDTQGQLDINSVLKNRPPAEAQLSPREIAAKTHFEAMFAKGLQLTVESIFTGETFTLTKPARFLGWGSTAIVFGLHRVKVGGASAPQQLAAKINVRSLQELQHLSSSQKKTALEDIQERFLREESSARNALQHVTPETALEHGVLFPVDVCRISKLFSGFCAGISYVILPVLALFPVFTCDLQQVVKSGLSRAAKLYITRLLLQAVAWLHANGVAHNDLKLENVLLSAEGKAVIADFGFAVKLGTASAIQFTAPYLDPQTAEAVPQEKTKTTASEERDAWALATLLFLLWCGSFPYVSDEQADLPTSDLLKLLVTLGKTEKPAPNFHLCKDLPPAVGHLVTAFLQWNSDNRSRPGDVLDDFLAATVSEGASA